MAIVYYPHESKTHSVRYLVRVNAPSRLSARDVWNVVVESELWGLAHEVLVSCDGRITFEIPIEKADKPNAQELSLTGVDELVTKLSDALKAEDRRLSEELERKLEKYEAG